MNPSETIEMSVDDDPLAYDEDERLRISAKSPDNEALRRIAEHRRQSSLKDESPRLAEAGGDAEAQIAGRALGVDPGASQGDSRGVVVPMTQEQVDRIKARVKAPDPAQLPGQSPSEHLPGAEILRLVEHKCNQCGSLFYRDSDSAYACPACHASWERIDQMRTIKVAVIEVED